MYRLLIVAIVLALWGCKEVVLTPEPIVPLYRDLAEFPSMSAAQRDSLLAADSVEISLMMQFLGHDFVWRRHESDIHRREEESHREEADRRDVPTIEELLVKWASSQTVKVYTPDVEAVFPSIESLENSLGMILTNAQEAKLDLPERRYVAVVWNSTKAIVQADTVVFIALNHFLGADYAGYRNSRFHQYQLMEKTPEQLPYALAEALIAMRYPYDRTESSTALSRMIYEGALVYAKLKVVPGATLSSTLGYSTDELEWLDEHYQQMWEIMISKNLVYTTSPEVAARLVDPAPSTSIISSEYPGRVGRYVGYRLVLSYVENNSRADLEFLLSPSFYNNPSELVLTQ